MTENIPKFELLNSIPNQRDPRACPFGVYVAIAFSRGGEQGFHWFEHEADVFKFIAHLNDRSSDEHLEATSMGDLIKSSDDEDEPSGLELLLAGVSRLQDLSLAALNDSQLGFSLRWVGSFESLMTESSRFAREIRNDHDNILHSRGALYSSDENRDRDAFANHVRRYAERFSTKSAVVGFNFSEDETSDKHAQFLPHRMPL